MTMTRRRMLKTTTMVAAGVSCAVSTLRAAAPKSHVIDTRVISHHADRYHGWPTLARRKGGELLLVCSGGRESHVCPFGRVELMRSHDGGRTWTWPETVVDGPIDDRDAGVLETTKGTLLVTTFTSLAYVPTLGKLSGEKAARWQAAHERLSESERQAALGVWIKRSTDGGRTWSGHIDSLVNSPHGPIQLKSGRLFYAGKDLWRDGNRVGVSVSDDDGASWQWLAEIPSRDGDDSKNYHELHAVEHDGRIVVQIRNHNTVNNRETLQTESDDGGKTWTTPHAIGVWGLPSHLLRLRDGRLLMSYGYRRKPFGNQARISDDGGQSWSEPIMISTDGAGGDLGYPSTVELDDGALLTAWYEKMNKSSLAVLRQARWTIS